MFARIKKSGKNEYLQLVQNQKVKGKVKQRVIATLGRMDELQAKGRIETLTRSLARFSEKALLILSGQSELALETLTIGPTLIFERLWQQSGIGECLKSLLAGRKFEFDVERAIFMSVLHRLMVSGSDRFCSRWRRDLWLPGCEQLELHHLYRAMSFLGEELAEPGEAASFSPRRIKDQVEEMLFQRNRDLFSELELVFFDTTSLYFEGDGGEHFGQRGFSKDHRPDLYQMVVGAVLDDNGRPICCEMWPGNTADVTTLLVVVERLRKRFGVSNFCVVADRGMISAETVSQLEANNIAYILGCRMRKVREIQSEILTQVDDYREVYSETAGLKQASALKVKEVNHGGKRYIVWLNEVQARKDALDRQAIVASLEERLSRGGKSLIGNKGYRKYLKMDKESVCLDMDKVKSDEVFDGKWVLLSNTSFTVEQVALKYKELWRVERVFRDVKSLLESRPIFHQSDSNIAGHVFCSFLALLLRKELDERLSAAGHQFEWLHIKQDLSSLQRVVVADGVKRFVLRTEFKGNCGKIFQALGVALPPTLQSIS